MESLGGEISAVWPDDSPHLRVEPDPAEVARVPQRLENSAPITGGEIDFSLDTVLEIEAETVIRHHFDTGDVNDLGHIAILRKRIDLDQLLFPPRALPI